MRSIVRRWLESPQFPNDEEKTARARLVNTIELNFGLILVVALIVYVPFFSNQKIESVTIILGLMALIAISRIFLFQRKLALASLFWITSMWVFCVGLAFLSGGINSPFMFGLLAITLIVGLLVHLRTGMLFLILSLLLTLGVAIFQKSGGALPQEISHSPLGSWFFFATSLVYIYWVIRVTVRRLENALAQAQINEAARQKVEDALRHNETLFRMFMQHIPGLAYIKDASGRVLFASQGFSTYLGLDADVMVGKTNLEIFGPVFGEKITQDDQQVLNSGGNQIIEEEFGGKTWSTCKFRIYQAGAPILLGGFTMDISERKQAEADLQKYVHIFEYAEWGIAVGSAEGKTFEMVNPAFATMHGYTVEELVGQSVLDVFSPENRAEALEQIQLSHEKGHHVYETFHVRKDGSRFPVLADTTAIRDEHGAVLYRVVNLTDITERKQVEEAEREQRALAEALSNSAAALNSTLNFDEVLDRIMDNAGRVVKCDAVGVLLLDEAGQVAQVGGYRNRHDPLIDLKGLHLPIAMAPHLREMQATGAPVIIGDVNAYNGWVEIPVKTWVRASLGVPIKVKGAIIGFLCLDNATPNAFTTQDARRLQAFVDHAALAIENARLYEEVQKLALTDSLTGVYNRTFFESELARMEHSRGFPLSIIIADLDNMKTTNDLLGHLAGDELLKRTVQVLQAVFRASEIIARIGGDEFVVLLPNTDSTTVEQILSRIRARLVEHNDQNPELPIQLSLGAATAQQGRLVETLIQADQRMYQDKTNRKGIL
jgi:diguanylate cyclase (GGDEF)-like protein/PAS domain S-box-containing protein